MIKSGEKKEEYREYKEYYHKRFTTMFERVLENQTEIVFRNGYNSVHCLCAITVGRGKKEWGAEPNKIYYILKILEVLQ